MRTLQALCAVAVVTLAAGSVARADYMSTFVITEADFLVSGFAEEIDEVWYPTAGPDYLYVDNATGTYDMDIPPAGTTWDVYVSGWIEVELDGDEAWDLGTTFDEYVGSYESPGPITYASGLFLFSYEGYDFELQHEVDLDGPYPSGSFGDGAFGEVTVSGDAEAMLYGNEFLMWVDETYGGDGVGVGTDGVITGRVRGELTVTCVPEPASLCLLVLGGFAFGRRR